MSKTDIEVTIGRKFIFGTIGVLAFLALIFFLLQVYDTMNKKEFYHKMYSGLNQSKEVEVINKFINSLDTCDMRFMKNSLYFNLTNAKIALDKDNLAIADSITAHFTLLEKAITGNSELIIPYGYGYIAIEGGYYSIRPMTDFQNSYITTRMMLAAKKNYSEDMLRDTFCEGKNLNTIIWRTNPKFEFYITTSVYWQ